MRKRKKHRNPNNNPKPKPPTPNPTTDPPSNKDYTDSAKADIEKVENHGSTENKFSQWILKWGMIVINFLLAVGTWSVFFLSMEQSESSKIAAKAAMEAVDTAKKQFEVENTPYIIISSFDSLKLDENSNPRFWYSVKNLGKQVIRVNAAKFIYQFDPTSDSIRDVDSFSMKFSKAKLLNISSYANYDSPVLMSSTGDTKIPQETLNHFYMKMIRLYIGIELHYTNLINNEKMKMEYFVLFDGGALGNNRILRIENTALK